MRSLAEELHVYFWRHLSFSNSYIPLAVLKEFEESQGVSSPEASTMGKARNLKAPKKKKGAQPPTKHKVLKAIKKKTTTAASTTTGAPKKPLSKDKTPHPPVKPTIPFLPEHNILLLGEGDFSFSACLAAHHSCASLTCTTFLSAPDLGQTHPSSTAHLATLAAHSATILYSIDATRLALPGTPSGAVLRSRPWDRIIFNFPHTGGLTKDVNRQVRANQELLAKFLGRAKELLAPGGQVVVTLFEGMPYELWGVRNLARHVGLRCGRSFRFDWSVYEGYGHVRTLGGSGAVGAGRGPRGVRGRIVF
jgi:25S rRNA (uracil2634-N3)-methyltransferase